MQIWMPITGITFLSQIFQWQIKRENQIKCKQWVFWVKSSINRKVDPKSIEVIRDDVFESI